MNNLFSMNFWISTIVSTLITMLVIVMIKRVTQAVDIPVVSELVQEV